MKRKKRKTPKKVVKIAKPSDQNKENSLLKKNEKDGKFEKGTSSPLSKKRFRATHTQLRSDLIAAFLEECSKKSEDGTFAKVVDKLFELALKGEVPAIKLLLDKALGSKFEVDYTQKGEFKFTLNVEPPINKIDSKDKVIDSNFEDITNEIIKKEEEDDG